MVIIHQAALRKGFSPRLISNMSAEYRQLVDEYGPKSKARGVDASLGGHLPVHLEYALEVLVEVLVGHWSFTTTQAHIMAQPSGDRVSSVLHKQCLGGRGRIPDEEEMLGREVGA